MVPQGAIHPTTATNPVGFPRPDLQYTSSWTERIGRHRSGRFRLFASAS